MLDFLFVIVAGAATVASPCILPLLPILLGTGVASRNRWRPLAIVSGFVLFFSAFIFLVSLFGSFLGLSTYVWRFVAAGTIILFGVIMLLPKLQMLLMGQLEPLIIKFHPKKSVSGRGILSGFLIGATLGLIWTPCAGPALGAITAIIVSKQQLVQSGIMLLAFSLGAGLPMLLIAYGGQFAVQKVRRLAPYTVAIQCTFGVLMILVGLAILIGWDQSFQIWLNIKFPGVFYGAKGPMCIG